MTTKRLTPSDPFDSRPFAFSQIVAAAAGHQVVHMSGQVAWRAEREILSPDDLHAQVVQSLRNIERAFVHVGASLDDVHALRIYTKLSHIELSQDVSRGLNEVFGDAPPCATWIGMPRPANEAFLVEIEPSAVTIPAQVT
ncbi:MAG: Rid family hydrolase [Alphaproteobacteria bacterium]|nr:Rid family hydrolase [Alphaproteobacteria bacterium]